MAEDGVAGRKKGRATDACCIGKRPDAADELHPVSLDTHLSEERPER
jgi:hypothetical protein